MAANPQYENIPAELAQPKRWIRYYLKPDPKKPDKKPSKVPVMKWATAEDRAANLQTLSHVLERKQPKEGVQRYIDKAEGFVYLDLDNARNPETGDVEPWASKLIESLDTYCEISASGKGFHLVARGTLTEDFHLNGNPLEIYSGNSNKLLAMTGDIHELHFTVEHRQKELDQLLQRVKSEANRQTHSQPESGKATPTKHWREVFHTGSELDPRPGRIYIEGFLPEGVTAIGAGSGVGKTWMGLSISHALLSGQPLFGTFRVLDYPSNVLYLVPEMGAGVFLERMKKMHISMDGGFYCQTVRDGACDLQDPLLLAAVSDMKPIVILDTAIRFQAASEENSSTDISQALGARVFSLINQGAKSVILMHHRSKGSLREYPTLENTLRGTGDYGAMCDCVWSAEHGPRCADGPRDEGDTYIQESMRLTRIRLQCVKPRDMEPAEPFVIQGKPYINERGDFVVLANAEDEQNREAASERARVLDVVRRHRSIGVNSIRKELLKNSVDGKAPGTEKIVKILKDAKVEKKDGEWIVPDGDELPF